MSFWKSKRVFSAAFWPMKLLILASPTVSSSGAIHDEASPKLV